MRFTPENKTAFDRLVSRYPVKRSALLPGLHLVQDQEGYISSEAIEYLASLLELTPAQVHDTATFYTMYRFRPEGRHHIEVCTNLSCALVGAKQVVDAFEEELGIPPGETSDDGEVTFRLIECAGGCGYAPVVVVDSRYREPTRPEDVPAIVEELRGR